jgi:hypothetical protein
MLIKVRGVAQIVAEAGKFSPVQNVQTVSDARSDLCSFHRAGSALTAK